MAKVVPDFVHPGDEGLARRGNKFLKLEAGHPENVIPLTNVKQPDGEDATGNNCIITFDQHSFWLNGLPDGKFSPIFPAIEPAECDPGRLLGSDPRFMGLMLVVTEADPDTEQILRLSWSLFKSICDVDTAVGGIKGKVLQVKRTGSGQATRYSLINTGRAMKIEGEPDTDLLDHIGPTTREDIIDMLLNVKDEMQAELGYSWPPVDGDPCDK